MIPGTSVTIGQPIGHRIDHMLSGTRANIAVKLFGPDLYQLRVTGAQVRDAMQSVPGVVDLQLDQQMDVPQLRIRADRTALAPGIQKGTLFKAYASALMRRTTRSRWYRQSRRRRQVPHRRFSPTSLHFGPSAAARILNASFEIMFCGLPPPSPRPGLPSTSRHWRRFNRTSRTSATCSGCGTSTWFTCRLARRMPICTPRCCSSVSFLRPSRRRWRHHWRLGAVGRRVHAPST